LFPAEADAVMDLTYPPEAEAFRVEFRAWLDEHLTDDLRGLAFWGEPDDDYLDRMRGWNRDLADAGYAAISWPEAFGGRDAGVMEQVVFAEEISRADAPGTLNPIGLANIAPSIMAFGTDAQQHRHLRPMLRGDEIWCQGFSEPDAGSDLASLSTSATPAGDGGWIVNGQKVWNTYGHLAAWCELLVRTDPDAPKHKGITCLLVDMTLPGIEVRPLRTPTGEADFSELFFTDVHVPQDALLGEVDNGWTVAMATLMFERGGVASLHLMLRRKIQTLIKEARRTGRSTDPIVRQQLASLYSRGETLRLLADRAVSRAAQGLPPGPESSLIKIVWSGLGQDIPAVALELSGVGALAHGSARDVVSATSLSIAGGTTEVNKNIVAERVLGLPREPR
jgi:alkylation response protein AidB-like acyl-CoA dehydrogenase